GRGGRIHPAAGAAKPSVQRLAGDPGVAAQRVVGELELVALADQDPERAIALARGLRRLREAAGEDLQRSLHLPLVILLADHARDDLAVDAEREQLALDPLGAP